jgi:hypothetical protein
MAFINDTDEVITGEITFPAVIQIIQPRQSLIRKQWIDSHIVDYIH